MNLRWLVLLPVLLAARIVPAQAPLFPILSGGDTSHVTPSLVADTTKISGGKTFTVGVRLQLAPGWHTYWQYPGESGGPPRIEWQLPEGFRAGEIQWPLPHARIDEGDLLTYIYEGDLVLPVEITPPASLPAGEVTLKAHVRWLVCEQTCIPGEGDVSLKMATGEGGEPANAEMLHSAQAQLPKTDASPFTLKWEIKADAVVLHLSGVAKEVTTEFYPLPPKGVSLGHPKVSEIAADGSRSLTLPISEGGSPTLAWQGVVVTTQAGGSREGWSVRSSPKVPTAPAAAATATSSGGAGAFALKLLAAFLGGLIMNVMPCVLPVIALKIFGFVGQGRQDPARVFRLGLAFNAGVFAFFLGLAAAVARLKLAFNFGYQFQNPYLLAGIIALVFVFALSLLGVFEISLGGDASATLSELSSREGYGGAFLHGLFTTLLGTSCTAPFLAGSLSYAATQSTPVIFLLFAAIAAGMCLPYFLLTARPAWLRFVPKPGAWMERIKQLMGFVMMALAVWLFSILGLRGAAVVAGMSWFLLALGMACWLFGTFREYRLASVAALALPVLGYYFFLHGKLTAAAAGAGPETHWKTGVIEWTAYTDARLADARKTGQAVFVDFTAEWCINCKTYERLVLGTAPVGAKFQEKKVVALRADWTNTDDPIVSRALKSFGRVGVPLYVLYRPGEDQPVVLDALTQSLLLAELEKIAN